MSKPAPFPSDLIERFRAARDGDDYLVDLCSEIENAFALCDGPSMDSEQLWRTEARIRAGINIAIVAAQRRIMPPSIIDGMAAALDNSSGASHAVTKLRNLARMRIQTFYPAPTLKMPSATKDSIEAVATSAARALDSIADHLHQIKFDHTRAPTETPLYLCWMFECFGALLAARDDLLLGATNKIHMEWEGSTAFAILEVLQASMNKISADVNSPIERPATFDVNFELYRGECVDAPAHASCLWNSLAGKLGTLLAKYFADLELPRPAEITGLETGKIFGLDAEIKTLAGAPSFPPLSMIWTDEASGKSIDFGKRKIPAKLWRFIVNDCQPNESITFESISAVVYRGEPYEPGKVLSCIESLRLIFRDCGSFDLARAITTEGTTMRLVKHNPT